MDLNYVRRLVKIFDDSSAMELRIEDEGFKIKLSKNNAGANNLSIDHIEVPQPVFQQTPIAAAVQAPKEEVIPIEAAKPEKLDEGNEVTSPIVGTFYRSPSPESDAFVEVGDHVNKGDVLCIVEAMKLMNEIESDFSGKIVKIPVENAQPIEYGQTIFIIKPD